MYMYICICSICIYVYKPCTVLQKNYHELILHMHMWVSFQSCEKHRVKPIYKVLFWFQSAFSELQGEKGIEWCLRETPKWKNPFNWDLPKLPKTFGTWSTSNPPCQPSTADLRCCLAHGRGHLFAGEVNKSNCHNRNKKKHRIWMIFSMNTTVFHVEVKFEQHNSDLNHTRWCSLQNRTCLVFHFTITSKLQNADISPELWGWGTWRHILSIGFGMFSDLSYNWYNMKIGYDFVVLVVLDPASLLKSLACSQKNNMWQGSRAFGASSAGHPWSGLGGTSTPGMLNPNISAMQPMVPQDGMMAVAIGGMAQVPQVPQVPQVGHQCQGCQGQWPEGRPQGPQPGGGFYQEGLFQGAPQYLGDFAEIVQACDFRWFSGGFVVLCGYYDENS